MQSADGHVHRERSDGCGHLAFLVVIERRIGELVERYDGAEQQHRDDHDVFGEHAAAGWRWWRRASSRRETRFPAVLSVVMRKQRVAGAALDDPVVARFPSTAVI